MILYITMLSQQKVHNDNRLNLELVTQSSIFKTMVSLTVLMIWVSAVVATILITYVSAVNNPSHDPEFGMIIWRTPLDSRL